MQVPHSRNKNSIPTSHNYLPNCINLNDSHALALNAQEKRLMDLQPFLGNPRITAWFTNSKSKF